MGGGGQSTATISSYFLGLSLPFPIHWKPLELLGSGRRKFPSAPFLLNSHQLIASYNPLLVPVFCSHLCAQASMAPKGFLAAITLVR